MNRLRDIQGSIRKFSNHSLPVSLNDDPSDGIKHRVYNVSLPLNWSKIYRPIFPIYIQISVLKKNLVQSETSFISEVNGFIARNTARLKLQGQTDPPLNWESQNRFLPVRGEGLGNWHSRYFPTRRNDPVSTFDNFPPTFAPLAWIIRSRAKDQGVHARITRFPCSGAGESCDISVIILYGWRIASVRRNHLFRKMAQFCLPRMRGRTSAIPSWI